MILYFFFYFYDWNKYKSDLLYQNVFIHPYLDERYLLKYEILVYFSSVELRKFGISTWTWRCWIDIHGNSRFSIEKEWLLCLLFWKYLLSCWGQYCIVCHGSQSWCSCLVKGRWASSMNLKWLTWPVFGYQRKSILLNLLIFIWD